MEFIPSLCVSERYDSNVFYAPSNLGLPREDFVTDVNPMLRVNSNGDYISGYLDVGGFGETYARNSDLNFFGTADTLYLSLDNSVKRLLPNASLIITDYVKYSPTPPGYSNLVAGTSPGSPVNIQNVYAQGLLSYRANNITNAATVLGTYKITAVTSLNATYSNSIIRFGSSPVTSGVALFDTTTHSGTLGASSQLTPLDTLSVTYSHANSEFTPHTGTSTTTSSGVFKTDSAIIGWGRSVTSYLNTQVGGGLIVINPGITTYALDASVRINTDNHAATLSYVRSAFPSFVGVGLPLITDTASLTADQKLALRWGLSETLNFSHGSGGSGSGAVTYNTYAAGIDLYYWITKIWSTALSFDYLNFQQQFGTTDTNFDRYAVTFNVKATWD